MTFIQRVALLALLLSTLVACGGNDAPAAGDDHADEKAQAADGQEEGHAEEGHEEGPPATTIPEEVAKASGIKVAAAGPGVIADEHEVQGLLTPVEGRVAQVMARFPGPVRALRANVGDRVRAGQTLAVIESNLSLSNYTVTAPISGVVLERSASVGAVAGEGMALFQIADLSQLWVDLHVFGADAQHIGVGSSVLVARMSDGVETRTTLERILPGTATASQSTVARASIDNTDGMWRPGSAVRARVTVESNAAELVVPLTALQSDEGGDDVIYVREGERYLQREVGLGRRDARHVEVLSGLRAGEQVVVEQSFLIKADIGKAAASHEH